MPQKAKTSDWKEPVAAELATKIRKAAHQMGQNSSDTQAALELRSLVDQRIRMAYERGISAGRRRQNRVSD